MFYVVYLTEVNRGGKHQIFPFSWMRDNRNQLDKFVLARLNRNQTHIFFWSNEKDENGHPNVHVEPNFDLALETSFPPPGDACFLGKPVYFSCDYEKAVEHKNRLRAQPPGIYNSCRLSEKPIPQIIQNPSDDDGSSIDGTDRPNSPEITDPLAQTNGNTAQLDLNDSVVEGTNRSDLNGSDEIVDDPPAQEISRETSSAHNDMDNGLNAPSTSAANAGTSHAIVKREPPEVFSMNQSDVEQLNVFLNDMDEFHASSESESSANEPVDNLNELTNNSSDDSDDEIVFHIVKNGFPVPFPCEEADLVKQEGDDISGDLAFKELVSVWFFFGSIVAMFVCTIHLCFFQLPLGKWRSYVQNR